MGLIQETRFALRFALREVRGGLKGFRVFLACLTLGVAAIAGVGTLTKGIQAGLQEEGQALLGGDIEIRTLQQPVTAEQRAHFATAGDVAEMSRLRAMARATDSTNRTLVLLKAVDDAYPLYGELKIEPAQPRPGMLARSGAHWGAMIDPALGRRLNVDLGDELKIGNALFTVRGFLAFEPDGSNEGLEIGPTVMVHRAAMPDTGLVRIGSLINYHYRIRTAPGFDIDSWREDLAARFPESRWRVRDRSNGAPGVRFFISRMGMFLTLVGLTALVVGGVGVGNAVRNYLDGKRETIATLKVLGATGDVIFRVYFMQVLLLSGVAIALGLALGILAPEALSGVLADKLPVSPRTGLYPGPLILAAVYGLLVGFAFALWPLAKTRNVRAAQLFRNLVADDAPRPALRYILAIVATTALVSALAIGFADLKDLAAGFVIGAAIALALLRLTGWAIQKAAANVPRPKRTTLRLAIANIHRPGAPTPAIVLSLGLGLTLFAALALVEGNLGNRVADELPTEAPAFFFVDIQKDQINSFVTLAEGIDGVSRLRTVPALRGPILQVAGVPADEVKAEPGSRWVLRGDRGLTYAVDAPEGSQVVEGDWWPADYSGPPLISFDVETGKGLGLEIGDEITLGVLGREITATVGNFRSIDWGTFGFNFIIIFAPGTLEAAPHTYMATLYAGGEAEEIAHRRLTDAFPNVTAVRMKEVLETVNGLLGDIGNAVRMTAVITIVAGIFVLAGAMAAGHRHRMYDAVILKLLGATRRDVLTAYLLEYLILGLVTGLLALGLGGVAGWIVVTQVMEIDFRLLPAVMAAVIAASIALTILFGLAGTWAALGARPAQVLREN